MIRTGMVLAGRYEVLEQIGSGGMAYVYKAKDKKLNRYVAIKVLKEEFCKDRSFVSKFRMEAQAAAGLSHNNVVGVYDVGEEKNIYFIVMELIDGITLKDYITRKHKLGTKESIGIAIQVAQGLDAAHKRHIVHRDIKPQNIIISRDGRIKVTDFGIARAITDETTNLYGAAGSVHYISPEQARGGYCDERSDIYSLGITLYEMVTGKVPFDGDTTVAVAISHINDAMIPPSEIEPSVPSALEQIIFKCTQKRPQQRYTNCDDLIKDLRHALVAPNDHFVHFVQPGEVRQQSAFARPAANYSGNTAKNDNPWKKDSNSRKEKSVNPNTIQVESFGVRSVPPVEKEPKKAEPKRTPVKRDTGKKTPVNKPADTVKKNPAVKKKNSLEEERLFDKILLALGIILGIVMLAMLIYIVGSLGGLFQRRVDDPAAVKKTEKEADTMARTYESKENGTLNEERAVVPDLLGLDIEKAEKKLEKEGLKINVAKVYEYSDEYDAGLICRQQYDEKTIVDKGTSVKVYLSLGTDKFNIDSKMYIGSSVSVLKYYLNSFPDINVEYYEKYSNDYEKDIVMYMEPDSGYISDGDTLKVYVSKGREYMTVPNLYEMERAQAIAEIEKAGFVVGNVSEANNASIPEGTVCLQSPEPSASEKSGTAIDITISLGPVKTTVPTLTGINVNQYAIPRVQAANLNYAVTYEENNYNAVDIVINQSPAAGTVVPEGTTVTLVVSSGPAGVALDPAALNNMPQEQAQNTVASLGLKYSIQGEYSSSVAAGCTIRWTAPSGQTQLHRGDTICIYISTGPAPTQPPETAPPADTAPAAPAPSDTAPAAQ